MSSYYARVAGVLYTFDKHNHDQIRAAVASAAYSVRVFARWTESGEIRHDEVEFDLTQPPDIWWDEAPANPRQSTNL